jgi:hypothetical protein
LEICDIFLNLFLFFSIENWGNWNLIEKNIFQFTELIVTNLFIFKQKISKNGFYLDQNLEKTSKNYRITKFDFLVKILKIDS